jgi:hypothetical protein
LKRNGNPKNDGNDFSERWGTMRTKTTQEDHRANKQTIRDYIQTKDDYTLAVLTATAKDGKLMYANRRKCVLGVCGGGTIEGYCSDNSELAGKAEVGMARLGNVAYTGPKWVPPTASMSCGDPRRNRIIYAICRAEQKRRERIRTGSDRHSVLTLGAPLALSNGSAE